jgi:rhodanese-related sulfurtransferase
LGDLINPKELRERRESGEEPLIIDVRGPEEYQAGHVSGAVNILVGELAGRLGEVPQGRLAVPY